MPKRATPIVLSEKEQEGLLQITKRHRSEQQVVLRARIVLAAAQGHANVQIASELDINVETLSLVERLQDAPRPGVKPKFSSEQRCQMAALACEAPAQAGRPQPPGGGVLHAQTRFLDESGGNLAQYFGT